MVDTQLESYLQQYLSKVISPKDLSQALETARSFGISFSRILVDKGLINEETLGKAIGSYLGFSYISLKNVTIPYDVLSLLPEDMAVRHKAVVFEEKDNNLSVGMIDPKNVETIDFIKKKTDATVNPYLILESDLREALNQYKVNLKGEFERIIQENAQKTDQSEQNLELRAKELPVIHVLDTLLEYAIAEKASDIHIEGISEDKVVIRFRLDGVLHDMITLSKELHPAIVARIKILSNLKIDEHRLPQDGRFKFNAGETNIALRVSIIPAFFGENIVLRLLQESESPKTLLELGFAARDLKIVTSNLSKNHGMILVAGPTGSGKTTTLYSLLNILNSPGVKICTVEDPIEYGMRRISQIQVNTQTGLTFAEGLRSLLRHDPNIIMVGEIRDKETAEIAIHAALTGHLVLSTLHTNDAPSAIPRFLDLGIEGFLLASTVNVVIAQRLVRKVCRYCMAQIVPKSEVTAEVAKIIKVSPGELIAKPFYSSNGCAKCNMTGYSGRVGIYEVFELDDEMKLLVTKQVTASEIHADAVKKGMTTMMQDGVLKATSGITTLSEVLRVAKE